MVMRIIQPQRLAEGIAQAGHPGLAGPVEPGQGLVGAECIKGRIVWHILPVDTSHILTPLEGLPDEILHPLARSVPR